MMPLAIGISRDKKLHSQGSRMPAAGGQPDEQRAPSRIVVQLERLRNELRRKVDDLFSIDHMYRADETSSGTEIFETVA